MKKILALLLTLAMLFSLAACTAEDAVEILDILLEEAETYEPGATVVLPEYTRDTSVEIQSEDWKEPNTEPADTTAPDEEEELPPVTTEEILPEITDDPVYTEPAYLDEDGTYTTKDDVALYILQYGHLPGNFITKKDAEKLGWPGGYLEPYAPGKCIGGSRFGNYEGLLPVKEGRVYTECDINTLGARTRGAERIVFSNDGLIFYTGDHYETFELLYGEVD